GVEELRRDAAGRYLVLASPGKYISVYAADGRPLGDIPSSDSKHPALISATDFDTDAEGRLYAADRRARIHRGIARWRVWPHRSGLAAFAGSLFTGWKVAARDGRPFRDGRA